MLLINGNLTRALPPKDRYKKRRFRDSCPYQFSPSLSGFYDLSSLSQNFENLSGICTIWPCLGPKSVGMWYLASGDNAKSGDNNIVLDLFALPEGLHFKLGLTLFQGIKEGHIDGREVKSTVPIF